MARIYYQLFCEGKARGGHKMIVRHVEALRDLGFDARIWTAGNMRIPDWLVRGLPVEVDAPITRKDVIVVPDDAYAMLDTLATVGPLRTVLFSQGPCGLADGLSRIDRLPREGPPTFMAVSPGLADTIARAFPGAAVELVPCFADERVFQPRPDRTPAIALTPFKRPMETRWIRAWFNRFHPEHAGLEWREVVDREEAEVARVFGSSTLFLSLGRFESVGLTALEAMASGCVCAGFIGLGGRTFATPENGFWVADDDCEAAAEALARAADLVATGGPPLEAMRAAARATAQAWSHAAFRQALEATWSRLAPDARLAPA